MIRKDGAALSVIIVNYFSEDDLKSCLTALEEESLSVEVIVVNNGSGEPGKTAAEQLFHELSWVDMGFNAGFGKACNVGARLATTRKLLFLNPDTRILPGALGHLDRVMDTPEYSGAIVGCGVYDVDGGIQLSCRRFPSWSAAIANRYSLITKLFPQNALSRTYLMNDFDHETPAIVDWVSGAAMAVRADIFERLNGFDENYFLYCEDVDLCKRAINAGILTRYYPDVKVIHRIGGSSRQFIIRAMLDRHFSVWKYYRRFHGHLLTHIPVAIVLTGRFSLLCVRALLMKLQPVPADDRAKDKRPAELS